MEAITHSQAIGFVITILIAVFSAWVNLANRVRTLEVRQDNDEKLFSEMKTDIHDIKKMLVELTVKLAKHER